MRVSAASTQTPKLMEGAWHVDAHVGPLASLPLPADLVATVFNLSLNNLTVGDEVKTAFGKFYVDEVRTDNSSSHVLLHTWAPGLVSRFGITVERASAGGFQAILHNSVHPRWWIGRVYFRLIEVGHHFVMEIALRRLAAKAGTSPQFVKGRGMKGMRPREQWSRWESWRITSAIFAAHVMLYRLLGGRLVGKNILILTTSGRRSGRKRSTPLYFVRDGRDWVIIASNGGDDRYPGWWHNIASKPEVEIEVGREVVRCRAEKAGQEDASSLLAKLTAVYGGYPRYQQRTSRELTIFRLKPEGEPRLRPG